MPLYHYDNKEDVPIGIKIVMDNEAYFILNTIKKLDSRATELLSHIDKGKFIDNQIWNDRYGRGLYWDMLSTGGKTVLNIFYNPEVCFWCGECGMNAMASINSFIHDGVVLNCGFWVLGPKYANTVLIESEGVLYTNIHDYCESRDINGYGIIYDMKEEDWCHGDI